ncbi:MAG: hypothetical protein U9M94_01390, partial [Patescibacteria group bacterium]|nr:hypothetical protein [Patescibacteria group bacterium]
SKEKDKNKQKVDKKSTKVKLIRLNSCWIFIKKILSCLWRQSHQVGTKRQCSKILLQELPASIYCPT